MLSLSSRLLIRLNCEIDFAHHPHDSPVSFETRPRLEVAYDHHDHTELTSMHSTTFENGDTYETIAEVSSVFLQVAEGGLEIYHSWS